MLTIKVMPDDLADDCVSTRVIVESSTLSPEAISFIAGVPYDEAKRKSQPRGHTGKLWEVHCWELVVKKHARYYGLNANALLPMCVQEMLQKIIPLAESLRELTRSGRSQFSIWVTCTSVPGISIDKAVIQLLADLGLSLDIDITFYIQRLLKDKPTQGSGSALSQNMAFSGTQLQTQ